MDWYGFVPDTVIRAAIRRLLAQRLRECERFDQAAFLRQLGEGPLAIHTREANVQHYEVPSRFYELVLGAHRKYSCGLWDTPGMGLDESERRMLDLTLERARVADGYSILDLGCGWGSLSLYAAERFPHSRITGVSNSRSQREYIEAQARQRALENLTVITADMNEFDPTSQSGARFDRVISVEMFEHMRNYRELLRRVASWLTPDGLLFVHIFAHTKYAYPFEVRGASDWMAQHFFTGGIMPSRDIFEHFAEDLRVREQWTVEGTHYQQTCEAWLRNLDRNRDVALLLFRDAYGAGAAKLWLSRWRIFFMACAELFGYGGGTEWVVGHYLLMRMPTRT